MMENIAMKNSTMEIKQIDGSIKILDPEKLSLLQKYADSLTKWNHLNLVADSTLNDLWGWHILDSLSIWNILENYKKPIIDFGSGGGILGVPLAIVGLKPITLVERSKNKGLFLSQILEFRLYEVYIGDCFKWPSSSVVLVRGVDKIASILEFFAKNCIALESFEFILFKSSFVQKEIDQALLKWDFQFSLFNRVALPFGKVVVLKNIRKKNACKKI